MRWTLFRGCMAGARPCGYLHINCNGDKEIRNSQPYCENGNLLAPCMVIDRPHVLRDLVEKYSANTIHPGSDSLINDKKISNFLDNYSEEFIELTDKTWAKEYKKSLNTGKKCSFSQALQNNIIIPHIISS